MIPFTLKFLTRGEFGVFAITGDILLALGLLQLGTSGSLNSRAAQLIGKGETANLSELASTALVIQSVAAMLMIVIGGLICLTIDQWFPASEPIEGLVMVVFVLILATAIRTSTQVFNGLLIASKRVYVENILGISLFLLRTVLAVGFLIAGMKLMALAWSYLIATVVISVVAYFRVRKELPEITMRIRLYRVEYLRDLLGNGLWFSIGGIAGILIVGMDRFMVGRYMSLEAVAAFVVTGKLYYIAEKMHSQIFNVMRPYFSQLHGQGEMKAIGRMYHAAFSGALLLSLSMASSIYLINEWFISWWIGSEYYIGNMVSFLFALNFVLQSSVLPNRILSASALYRLPQQNIARVSEGLLNLGLTIVLVSSCGIVGVLLASVIATLVCSVILLNVLIRSYLKEVGGQWYSAWAYIGVAALVLVFFVPQIGFLGYGVALILLAFVGMLLWRCYPKGSQV